MPSNSWEQLINDGGASQTSTGSALTNSVSLTDISPGGNVSGEALLIPGSYLNDGVQLRVTARGIASTSGTPNLTLGIFFGGVAGSALAESVFSASANMSNNVWSLHADIRVDATGTSANLRTMGEILGLTPDPVLLPQTSSSGGLATVASGTSEILTLGAQWGTGSTSNSIQVFQFIVEQLN